MVSNLISKFQAAMGTRFAGERGAGIAEYALLVALIAVVALGGIQLFGNGVSDFFGGLPAQLGF
ncbi:MAG: Flp family type IVb pilin [Actinomycetota bacterium]